MPLLNLLILQLIAYHLLNLLLLFGLQSLNGSHLVLKHRGFFRTGLGRHHRSLVKGRHSTLRGPPVRKSTFWNGRLLAGLRRDSLRSTSGCLVRVICKPLRIGSFIHIRHFHRSRKDPCPRHGPFRIAKLARALATKLTGHTLVLKINYYFLPLLQWKNFNCQKILTSIISCLLF